MSLDWRVVAAGLFLAVAAECDDTGCESPKASSAKVSRGFRLGFHVVTSVKAPVTLQCAKQCLLRAACRSFNFEARTEVCELSDSTAEEHPPDKRAESSYVYSDRSTWPSDIVGACASRPCTSARDSVCTPAAGGGYRCGKATERECVAGYYSGALSYRGSINHTEGGTPCQRWDEQTPHAHNYGKTEYFEENYCRLDSSTFKKPWCYPTTKIPIWDYCPVPLC